MPDFSYFERLQTAAEAYFYLGWSVIPLLGDRDPSRPKAPAVAWAAFQQVHASLPERQQWFIEGGFGGLGIVTGRISKLVVLDFDSEAVFNAFQNQYPDLLETHMVRSAGRQLPHLYFYLPDHLQIASRKGQGIDLLSDGRYVAAPPTTINGNTYQITRGGMPMTLTKYDVGCINKFLNAHPAAEPHLINETSQLEPVHEVTAADLQHVYRRLLLTHGRNDALFRTSLFGRDSGQTAEQVKQALVTLHSQQPCRGDHPPETVQGRQREALKTIDSAFSRPPKPLKPPVTRQQGFLSNSVREKLMQQHRTYVVRTVEGLYSLGIHPGEWVTADEAVTGLDGVVGRDSVLKALKAVEGERPFFKPGVQSKNTENTVSRKNTKNKIKKCFLIAGKNQEKPKGGRPAALYRMPSNHELCDILGVKMTASDALEQADVTSARQTRMAVHRELIKRRSGQYSKHWLAGRLGVSQRTIRTYTRLLPIRTQAMYIETVVHWKTLDQILGDEPLRGAFLQTAGGKKYPALREIACRLLAQHQRLCLKQQTANFYWYDTGQPPPPDDA